MINNNEFTIMSSTSETLDAEELLHLAIHASQKDETEKAIDYLKRALNLEAKNARILYMLGSLHAEIGMYERAIKEMQQAVELEPGLHTAQFQLGLLELTSGNVESAKKSWSALDSLDDDHYLRIFSNGLLLLIQDKFDEATQMLQKGISLNNENIPLNNDMMKFITEIENNKNKTSPVKQENTVSTEEEEGKRILSAYQNDFNH